MASPVPHIRAGLRALDGGLPKQAIVHFSRALAADGHPADRLHHVGGLSNLELAECIAAENIDVLVDLSAYSTPARLGLFVSPVAPVVVAWFNSYATSGLPGIDVIVGDDETVRPGEERFYSESVRRLPLSYLTFDGDRWASRTSQTLLRRCHLAEFAAESMGAMIAKAHALAADPATPGRLADLRSRMRERLVREPVCDGAALARSMEALYAELLAAK